jgi:ribonuclease BN (tRNA processing enzyme)
MHLTAREAGAVAMAAGVQRLLLTHFRPGNDRVRSRAEAFGGEILIADEELQVLL